LQTFVKRTFANYRRETTIFARIKRLENSGIIKEYRAILDPKAIGKNVLAFVLIKYDPSSGIKQREIAEKLQTYQKFKKFI
jgi:Lrp/AsnC family transcriptional regulator for asnA, asnC and gidA